MLDFEIKDIKLAPAGKKRIEWALNRMPVLKIIQSRFAKEKPLKNLNIGACLHVTTETAALAIALKEAGANLALCASNPLSTQDDVAASLVHDFKIEVFAINNENNATYYKHIKSVLSRNPKITLDDGADLISTIHKSTSGSKPQNLPWGSTEETTTGVIRLKALAAEKKLLYPIIAVNDAYTKHLFDNRYGTGQSTLDGILRATNKLIAGEIIVVCGYGWCGRGIAQKAKGLGANVIVSESDSLRGLEAAMDGFSVMPIAEASKKGNIFITATGNIAAIGKNHFLKMKDQAILANAGHFDVEIDTKSLKAMAKSVKEVKPLINQYTLPNGRRICLLAEGRLVNLACAEGHPAEVMDLSFANQALSCEYIAKNHQNLTTKVYSVPEKIDKKVAELKLKSMGIKINNLTSQQKKYLNSWEQGT